MKRWMLVFLVLFVSLGAVFAGGGQAQSGDKQITISVWSGYPEMEAYFKYCGEEYTKLHPNVKIETLTNPLREFEQKLAASVPSNTAGDIVETSDQIMLKFIEAGLVPAVPANVKSFVTTPGRYPPSFVESGSYKNEVYGVPSKAGVKALFWNTEMFKAAGLTRAPRTFAEVSEYAKKLAVYDSNGVLTRSGHSLRLSGQGSGIAEKFEFVLYPMGGDILVESKTQPGKYHAGYNNDAGRKALKFYIDAVYVDKWDSFEVKHDTEAFELGTTAMFFRESNVVGDIAQKVPNLPYDTALIPSDVRSGCMKLTDCFFVTKSCKNPEVAYDFILFMVNDANERWLLDNVGWPPSRNDVDYSPVYAKTPQLRVFVEKAPDGYTEYNNTRGVSCFDEVQTRLAERLATAYLDSSLVNNPAGIAKAIADAAEETNAILRRNGVYGE
jgi:multiple sugar transport system substrate-binding protein